MKVNYHTHTYRCKHAGGTEEDYIKAAIENDFDIIGISDHAPFPDYDFGYRMDYCELDEYINTLGILRNTYKSDIRIYTGLEIEYFSKYDKYYEELLAKRGIDYMILGEHIYERKYEVYQNIYNSDSTECYIEYANAIKQALKTGYFKILAHPDLCMLCNFPWDYNCDKALDIIIDAVVSSGTIIEYNANGLRRGIQKFPDGDRYPYPHDKFWTKISQAGLPVVVGADSHSPEQLWDEYLMLAYDNLKKLGITPLKQDICRA